MLLDHGTAGRKKSMDAGVAVESVEGILERVREVSTARH